MNSFIIPRVFRRTKDTKESAFGAHQSYEASEAKIQYILGITNAELKSARSGSVSSSSTARLQSVSLSEATTVPNPGHHNVNDGQHLYILPSLDTGSSFSLPKKGSEHAAVLPKLHTCISISTLSSHYDPQSAPLSVSQQTSDSSSRDFALGKDTSSMLTAASQDKEHARQLQFFNSSRSRTGDSRQSGRLSRKSNEKSLRASPVLSIQPSPIRTETIEQALPSIASTPASPTSMTPIRRLFSHKNDSSLQPTTPRVAKSTNTTPFVKVHVRRPKVGAKYWFDGLQGDSSDEDNDKEVDIEQTFADDVQRALERIAKCRNPTGPSDVAPKSTPPQSETTYEQPSVPYRILCPLNSAPAELPSHETSSRLAVVERKTPPPPSPSKHSPNRLKGIDLNKQSVLNLSSSEDEGDGDERPPIVISAKHNPLIRESIAAETIANSEIEVGLALTIKTIPGGPITQPLPIRTEREGRPVYSPFPVPLRPRASSRLSQHSNLISEADLDERDIITAFPATPSETSSLRTSIRTSAALSDNASITSTRMMQVTKQEQRLLAAMRSKRAAMQEAGKAADRRSALKVLESGEKWPTVPVVPGRALNDDQDGVDGRLSNRYAPPRGPIHRRSLSGGATVNTRGSGTTFQTSIDSYSKRGSQATWRSEFSDDFHLSYLTHNEGGRKNGLPPSSRTSHDTRLKRSAVRDTFLSMESDSSGYRRSSHVVMLDELDESVERENIPSQLFLETPFVGWDKMPLTAAH